MPQNYDKLGGGVSAFQEWVHAGNQSKRIPGFSRNASFYPWFGHSHDLRWVLDYHTENQSSIYNPGRQFWQVSTHRRLSSLRLITMAHPHQLILHRQYTLYYSTRIGYRERERGAVRPPVVCRPLQHTPPDRSLCFDAALQLALI